MTGMQLIRGALLDLQVLDAVADPSAEDAEDARLALNELLDSFGIERNWLYKVIRTTKTLTASTANYTIGTGGSISVAKPTWIDRAGLIIDTTATEPTEVPIDVLTEEEYAGWPSKTQEASQSSAVYYDHGHDSSGYGLIYPLPIPDVSTTQLVLYTPGGGATTFADLVTDYAMPKGYQRAIRKNLALELAPMHGAQPSPLLLRQAEESKAAVKRANVRPFLKCPDPALTGWVGHWNIETDHPNRGGW